MLRGFCSLIVVSAFVMCFDASGAHAQISRENPYRSFNISGVNYGSLRWEEQHRKQTQPTYSNPQYYSTQPTQSAQPAMTQRGIFGFRRFRR